MLFWLCEGALEIGALSRCLVLQRLIKKIRGWSKRDYRFLLWPSNFEHPISIRSVKDLSYLFFPSLRFVTILATFIFNRHSPFPKSIQQSLEPNSAAFNLETCPPKSSNKFSISHMYKSHAPGGHSDYILCGGPQFILSTMWISRLSVRTVPRILT